MRILGIDEAGRGPVIGPMVMAGFMIDDKNLPKLNGLKVRDSKLHTPKQRTRLYDQIILLGEYEIVVVLPEEIDASLEKAGYNLNWLEADKIAQLTNKMRPGQLIADCPSPNIQKFTEYVKARLIDKKVKLVLEHKADENYPVVSAASILAKVTRDSAIATLRKIYGDFGSGYLTDPKTQVFMKKDHNLPIFRKSWISWKRIEEKKGQKSLADF